MQIISCKMFIVNCVNTRLNLLYFLLLTLRVWAPPKLLLLSTNSIYTWWIGNWCRTFLVLILKMCVFFSILFPFSMNIFSNKKKGRIRRRRQSFEPGHNRQIAAPWKKSHWNGLKFFMNSCFFFLHVNIFLPHSSSY